MKEKLKVIWIFVKSLEGLIIILSLVSSLIIRFYFNFRDLSFLISLFGFIISIIIIIKNKFSEINILEDRLKEYNIYLDKISNNSVISINKLSEKEIVKWKREMIKFARKELSKNIGVNEEQLIKFAINEYVNLFNFDNKAKSDFIKYLLFSLVFHIEREVKLIIKEYTKKSDQNKDKVYFLSYVYAYFIENKKDIKILFESTFNYTQEDLTKALFFIKNSLEEVNEILDRIKNLKNIEEKNRYLEKLNEKIREYLHTKGVSVDKYGETFLSKLDNAYLIFQQKLGKELRISLEDRRIKNIPLYFTGPYLIISNDINSAYELKNRLGLNVKPSKSHNLLIVRVLPSDSFISTGLDKNAKENSKKQLKKIKDVLTKVAELSSTTKHYALILDRPLQDFIESLHYDFLVMSNLPQKVKQSLREKTNKIKDELRNITGRDIEKLTDVYNVSKENMSLALKKAEVNINTLDKISKEIIRSAKVWRYILYGYNGEENE